MTDVVIFDLDGTISDSARGIIAALRLAFADHGIAPLEPADELALVGPPFHVALLPYVDAAQVQDVIDTYRRHYRAGLMYETAVFPGIPDVLHAARAAGLRLAVATSKPEVQAAPIVAHLGLAPLFETVGGDELDASRGSKALVIGEVLRRLGDPGPADVLMVGDRAQDVVGAAEHGIRCIGAGWGYAQPGELAAAGASPICATPADLAPALALAALRLTAPRGGDAAAS